MEQTEELIRAIEEAKVGSWFPMAIISGVFSIIILLLLYIWNQMIKNNNTRHETNEKLLRTAMDNQTSLTTLVNRHDVEIEHLKKKDS